MKRMLAGLVLRWLWILETDNRLLNDAIALVATLGQWVSRKGNWQVEMV
jgi:hypothetical protein